ncbi:MAG: H-type lectin domain-containing protein, partial [Marinomonas sp.]
FLFGGNIAASLLCIAIALSCLLPSVAHAGRIEAGTFVAHDTLGTNRTPDFVSFQQTFDTPPIVIILPSQTGANSATVTVQNVTTTGFDELIVEPDNWDGRHLAMTVHYVAVEPGRHVLPDGQIIEAGLHSTTTVQFGTGFTGGTTGWDTVNFSSSLPNTPTILHHLQTTNSETSNVANAASRPHITSIAQSPSLTGFQLAIDRSQANSGPFPSTEVIGWIAFPSGGSGDFPNTAGTAIDWSATTTGFNIRGWDDGCTANPTGISTGTSIVVAKKLSRRNDDGGWLRYCAISSNSVTLRVDEDRDQDTERNIAAGDAERAAIVAFSQAFHANLAADLTTSKVKFSTSGTYADFELPGALVEYQINVTNEGNAPPNYDTVEVTDALPRELALVVTDFAAPGSGPVQFTDGSPATTLTCPFVSLANTGDCIAFSIDGSDFSYVPTDSGDGTDPAVTHIRVTPTGAMRGDTGSGDPNFELRLRARIK